MFHRHACALGVLGAVLALGFAATADFGLAIDEPNQQKTGQLTVDLLLGENTRLLSDPIHRHYGAAFQVGLVAFQRLLGLTDTRDIFLSRYLLTHAFFLVGAFSCYLLAHRLFKSRALALFAMLLLLCHPRMYGHSFFNSKDVPFLSMFLIALLMAHGALRRAGRVGAAGDVGAFAGLGAWLGLAGTIRPMAFLLVALVALVRCAGFFRTDRRDRIRMLLCSGVLGLASVAAFFAGLPYLWGDPPTRFVEWLRLMSDHHNVTTPMFLGERIRTDERPLAYVPVWIAVTTPLFATLLALLGGVALCARLAARPCQALADPSVRFAVLLAACVLATVAVVTFGVGNIYNGWRHLYFLYGPMCIGAAGGLAWLCRNVGRRLAALAGAVAALGLVCAVVWVVRLHPHEHVYFNFLVDRKTPDRLRNQFRFKYWGVEDKEALEFLLDAHQGEVTLDGTLWRHAALLRPERRRRVAMRQLPGFFDMDNYFWERYRTARVMYLDGESVASQESTDDPLLSVESYVRPFHSRKVYWNSNTLYALARLEADLDENSRYSADYREALATPAAAMGPFNVHWHENAITYLREDCELADREVFNALEEMHMPRLMTSAVNHRFVPSRLQLHPLLDERFFLHVFRDNKSGPEARGRYRVTTTFPFHHRGVLLRAGGSRICMARIALQQHDVDTIHTGQLDAQGEVLWFREIGRADSTPPPRTADR